MSYIPCPFCLGCKYFKRVTGTTFGTAIIIGQCHGHTTRTAAWRSKGDNYQEQNDCEIYAPKEAITPEKPKESNDRQTNYQESSQSQRKTSYTTYESKEQSLVKSIMGWIIFVAVISIIITYLFSMGTAGYIIVPIIIGYTLFRILKETTFIYNIFNGIWMIVVLAVGIRIIKEEYAETGNAIFEIILVIIMVMIPSLLKLIFKLIKAIFKKIFKLISR
jgi:hypothetical protein